MLNKKLSTCSPVLLQDLEDEDDDDEFEVRRSSSPAGGFFFHNDNDLLFSTKESTTTTTSEGAKRIEVVPQWGVVSSLPGAGPCSSSTVSNAITLAPSRNHSHDPNVFAGGRAPKKHKRHKGHHHQPPQRGKSPPGEGGSRVKSEGSILNRIDHSIMSNFGDWSTVEEEPPHKPLLLPTTNKSRSTHRPYYLPSKGPPPGGEATTSDPSAADHAASLSLPKLFKPYEVVVGSPGKKAKEGGGGGGRSRDNADPNSILSEAKRTLNAYGVHLTVD